MGIYSTKSMWQKALKPIVDLSVRRQIHPDVFTYSAIIISVIGAIGLYCTVSEPLGQNEVSNYEYQYSHMATLHISYISVVVRKNKDEIPC